MHFLEGFPITPQLILSEATKYNEEREMVDGWKPGNRWYLGFIRRNPEISKDIRTRKNRIENQTTSESDVREWYQKVMDMANQMNWRDCFQDAQRIFNMDEISFCLNPEQRNVLTKRGSKNTFTSSMKVEKDYCTVLLGGKWNVCENLHQNILF